MNYLEYVRRTLRFYLSPRTLPTFPGGFSSPVVVIGSAPTATIPSGFDANYRVITINGSQAACADWGRVKPDVTIMTGKQLSGENTNAVSVRSVISGRSTGLLLMLWSGPRDDLKSQLARVDYHYDALAILSNAERMALHHHLLGTLNREMTKEDRFSNGITGVLYALANKAPAVIISGINPHSSGHVYNDANLKRQHSDTDGIVIKTLVARGHPVFTSDEAVARSLGIPEWNSGIQT